jgi:hypothetical protein
MYVVEDDPMFSLILTILREVGLRGGAVAFFFSFPLHTSLTKIASITTP